jgi:Kef-type K+ transport system membrane component KefB
MFSYFIKNSQKYFFKAAVLVSVSGVGNIVLAAEEEAVPGGHGDVGFLFLLVGVALLAAKLGGVVEKFNQPSVLGELFMGIVLSALAYFGVTFIDELRHNETIAFLAEFGVVILLFQIGLESNIGAMKKVGTTALMVALVGVIVPFVLGTWILGPLLFGEEELVSHLFLGASLVATSVGITASVFQSFKINATKAAQTVLGAAVIDDVLGLVVLAIVSALASGEEITFLLVMTLTFKALGFLVGAIVIGRLTAGHISRFLSTIHPGIAMKLTLAMTFALSFAYLASLVGLAPIVGAFAAGLLLDPVHFTRFHMPPIVESLERLRGFDKKEKEKITELIDKHRDHHIEDLISSLSLVFVPVFFLYTGLSINFESLLQPSLYLSALIITVAAILGKFVAGFAAKGDKNEKYLIGASMVPRGEVGLIFAATGKGLGVLTDEMFSIIVIVVILTTFVAPFGMKFVINRQNAALPKTKVNVKTKHA